MTTTWNFVTALALASAMCGTEAWAADQYNFPSPNGAGLSAQPSVFVPLAPDGGTPSLNVNAGKAPHLAPPAPTTGTSHSERFGMRSAAAEAYTYRFLTHALNSSAYANYAADYVRLFAPGYAVSTWTDRVAGVVDAGYGGAVDGWTAAAYYLPRLAGPMRRRESAPDLNPMPAFRPHPELQSHPTFNKGS